MKTPEKCICQFGFKGTGSLCETCGRPKIEPAPTPITDRNIRTGGGCHYVDRDNLVLNGTFKYVDPFIVRTLERQRYDLLVAAQAIVEACRPNERDHPAIFPAWARLRNVIESVNQNTP